MVLGLASVEERVSLLSHWQKGTHVPTAVSRH